VIDIELMNRTKPSSLKSAALIGADSYERLMMKPEYCRLEHIIWM